jgi:two-component system NtrC family response regulator
LKNSSVLIIDDERAIRSGISVALSEAGYLVESCATGRDGLNQALSGNYDLILLDIKLPDIDGMEILKTICQKKLDTHVIIMTGFASVQNAVEALKLGAYDYLSKPFSSDELIIAVNKAIEHKTLKDDNLTLRRQLYQQYNFNKIVGEHPRIKEIFAAISKVAPTDSTVLLDGESGTGKEIFAGYIHTLSRRASHQFIITDCNTFSDSLLESELFGHVKGAFTGAIQNKSGIFASANGGTLFLDEIANLSLEIQGKLLRVMESHEYKPVGGSLIKKSDVRIIAATNRDLETMVENGEFRPDLFYRMNVFPIFLPPLRERKSDIPKLAYHFLRLACKSTGKKVDGFSDDAMEMMVNHDWPGNIRQLKNVVERLVIMSDQAVVNYNCLQNHFEINRSSGKDLLPSTLTELKSFKCELLRKEYDKVEKAFLQKALTAENGNISRASRRVGMQRSNFSTLLKKHRL